MGERDKGVWGRRPASVANCDYDDAAATAAATTSGHFAGVARPHSLTVRRPLRRHRRVRPIGLHAIAELAIVIQQAPLLLLLLLPTRPGPAEKEIA
jgi:hypothetical protein